jgi:hypothetical protein
MFVVLTAMSQDYVKSNTKFVWKKTILFAVNMKMELCNVVCSKKKIKLVYQLNLIIFIVISSTRFITINAVVLEMTHTNRRKRNLILRVHYVVF